MALYSRQSVINLEGGALGDVPFPHQQHQKVLGGCDDCHRLFPKEKGVIQKYIAENKLKKKEAMDHCVDCHKDRAGASKKSGPVKCNDCHKKQVKN